MNLKFFKGLLAAVIAMLASVYGVEGANVYFYITSVFGAVLVYFAQNALIKPVTVFGTLDLRDVLKGIILSIGTAASTYAASLLTGIDFTLANFGNVLWVAFVTYISKNLLSNSQGELGFEKK